MKRRSFFAAALVLASCGAAASFAASAAPQRAWLKLSNPTAAEAAAQFQTPPAENGPILWWGWDGPVDRDVIRTDLDRIKAMGFSGVMMEAGNKMQAKYLSPEWFELFAYAVQQARERDMRLWVEDEGKYPSGFVGGRFTKERPDLCMQIVSAGEQFDVAAGESVARTLPTDTICAVAYNTENGTHEVLPLNGSELKWTAPAGKWQVVTTRHIFRSGPTAWVDNPTGARKDTSASLCDYLNPESTRKIIEWTYEGYRKAAGEEFGRTFMGFMGDEPAFVSTPWTPTMLDEFQKRKGYDIRPYLRYVAAPPRAPRPQPAAVSGAVTSTAPAAPLPPPAPAPVPLTAEQRRARADYWDVWSDLYSENYFKQLADWCTANNCEYIVHLDQDNINPNLVRTGGDFFKNMRHVAMPGVDAIWAQIWFDHQADYPKLASSAAHVFGRPHAFTESFAAFTNPVDVPTAKWVIDYQLVRGINFIQVMFMSASSGARVAPAPAPVLPSTPATAAPVAPSAADVAAKAKATPAAGGRGYRFYNDPAFPAVARATHRAAYLLSSGTPAAQIGVYLPTTSLALGDVDADKTNLAVAELLLNQQRDFDWVDEHALSSLLKLEGGELKNLSGQGYRTIIVPGATVISRAALNTLQKFADSGGKVVFFGTTPSSVTEKTFLHASGAPDLSWAVVEPEVGLTPKVLASLPKPDVTLSAAAKTVKYVHRKLRDADVYFFFNEGKDDVAQTALLAGTGNAQRWDAETGRVENIEGAAREADGMRVPLNLKGHESRIVVIRKG